jgi:hypothetical protein
MRGLLLVAVVVVEILDTELLVALVAVQQVKLVLLTKAVLVVHNLLVVHLPFITALQLVVR